MVTFQQRSDLSVLGEHHSRGTASTKALRQPMLKPDKPDGRWRGAAKGQIAYSTAAYNRDFRCSS